ncbi:MAG TPA: surface-adhesin E family protein [Casimicrobiaceae bacterium]|nr:surface-adhesin E family protein [Casimicrobiaceae bacterium]
MSKAVVAVVAFTIGTIAHAAWEPLATSQLGDRKIDIYIDPDRIREQNGHKMVWQLDNLKDDVPKEQARSAVRLFALDCAKMSTALADVALYKGEMGKGQSLGRNVSKTLEFEPALPDSIAEVLLFRVCIPPDEQKRMMQGDAAKAGTKPAAATPATTEAPKPAPMPEPAKKP